MCLSVVRVYDRGRKLSERELWEAEGIEGDVRIQTVGQVDGRWVRQAICMALTIASTDRAQLVAMSPRALGLEGYEEGKTAAGIVFYRQGWWCRMR
ncbi:MAG TPA: hypothetical protein VK466_00830 [Terriglobales bacterium]|nr:hypothetical protein [Terriglobales bacterium]